MKNISLPLSHPLALARSNSMSNSVANKTKFRKKVLRSRAGLLCNNITVYDATFKRKGKLSKLVQKQTVNKNIFHLISIKVKSVAKCFA